MHLPPRRRLDPGERGAFGNEFMHELTAHCKTTEEMKALTEVLEYVMGHQEECERIEIVDDVKAILRRDGSKWQFSINTFTSIIVLRFAKYPQFTPIRITTLSHIYEGDAQNYLGDDEIEAVSRAMEIAGGDHGWVVHSGCHHHDDKPEVGDQLAELDTDLMTAEAVTEIENWLRSQ